MGLHAILLMGFWVKDGVEIFQSKNSWGTGFGHNGIRKIRRELVSKIMYPTDIFWCHRGLKSYQVGLSKGKEEDKDGGGNKGNKRSGKRGKLGASSKNQWQREKEA